MGGTGARTRAWGVALHLWEAPSLTPVKISAPTSPPTLRHATALRSPATWVTHLRVVGLATIALTPFNLGTTALACATTCATGRLKNRATWVWTPMERIASGYGSDYGFGSGFDYGSGSNFDYGSG